MTSVLIVEDDPQQTEALKLQLASCGYRVVACVDNGKAAIAQAQELDPDVVLMDIVLSGKMDGIEAAQKIRATCDVPVLYLTAYADDEFFRRAQVTDPYAYLLKPSTPREIQLAIEIALYHHQAERATYAALEKAVTERTAAIEQARLSISNILASISDAFISLSSDWHYTYANAKAGELFGRKPEDLIGKHIWTEFPEGVGQPFYYAYLKAMAEQTPVELEAYYPAGERWFQNRIFPAQDGLSIFFHDITERKEHDKQLERIAHYDTLTGIPNRTMLNDRMGQAITRTNREQNMMAVCYLDLDGFKPINDTMGHDVGDRVLIEIAQRIQSTLRGWDTVARLGGDEFVVLLVGLERGEECNLTLQRLLGVIAEPLCVMEHTFNISASIGVSIFPLDEVDTDTLLRHADQAMYVAKQSGKNRFHIYDTSLDHHARNQQELLKSIQLGLENQQFELHYQPKINFHTQQLVGAEALIRWNHPERGLLSPASFLPAVENTEHDIALGEWVIASALQQLDIWHKAGLEIEVSINISTYHLESTQFLARLRQQLLQHPGVPANCLQIEILETVALKDIGQITQLIENCQKLGVSFALDDFGTGFSSLSYLSRLPVDVLKIDQSFMRNLTVSKGDHAIVLGIIALSRAFGLKAVAEGVETALQFHALLDMGCDIGQGYGIARPMPAAKLADWARKNKSGKPLFTDHTT